MAYWSNFLFEKLAKSDLFAIFALINDLLL